MTPDSVTFSTFFPALFVAFLQRSRKIFPRVMFSKEPTNNHFVINWCQKVVGYSTSKVFFLKIFAITSMCNPELTFCSFHLHKSIIHIARRVIVNVYLSAGTPPWLSNRVCALGTKHETYTNHDCLEITMPRLPE